LSAKNKEYSGKTALRLSISSSRITASRLEATSLPFTIDVISEI
jgi:hypothetical protein